MDGLMDGLTMGQWCDWMAYFSLTYSEPEDPNMSLTGRGTMVTGADNIKAAMLARFPPSEMN